MERAVERRRREFVTARACARAALEPWGLCERPIPMGSGGEPQAWFPLARRRLGFGDAVLTIDPRTGAFAARLLVRGPPLRGGEVRRLAGRWAVEGEVVLTAVVVPREAG